jgi:hypothetical protein
VIANRKPGPADFDELLRRAQDEGEPPDAARAVGVALADIYVERGTLDQAPLAAFTTDVYLAFDARVAALQRQSAGG